MLPSCERRNKPCHLASLRNPIVMTNEADTAKELEELLEIFQELQQDSVRDILYQV